ncbi:MAG: ROK family protein [Pyrinomonadaceae bacterium]|nr:ROK family protein [Pyrinomonadaceae bacterium]
MSPESIKGNSLGIEATNSMFRVVVLSDDGNVTYQNEIPTNANEQVVPQLANLVSEVKRNNAIEVVGLAVSGLVSRRANRVILSTQFPSLAATDVAAELANLTKTKVFLENDANSAAFGEFKLGAGRGSNNMFYATIGIGIGGAIILDGKLWRGATGFAGEFGHIAINEDGEKLEDVASAANISRRVKERLFRDNTSSLFRNDNEQILTINNIVQAAKDGDDFAQLMLERTGAHIGTAIASVINLLNVERIVIGGEVMEAGRVILTSVVRRAGERSFQPSFEATTIAAAELGASAVAIGAAFLAKS